MEKFWKWVDLKKYNYLEKLDRTDRIGRMIEYLREKTGKIILNVGGRASIKDVYNNYVKIINKL